VWNEASGDHFSQVLEGMWKSQVCVGTHGRLPNVRTLTRTWNFLHNFQSFWEESIRDEPYLWFGVESRRNRDGEWKYREERKTQVVKRKDTKTEGDKPKSKIPLSKYRLNFLHRVLRQKFKNWKTTRNQDGIEGGVTNNQYTQLLQLNKK